MRGRNQNFDLKFGFSVKFRVEGYAKLLGLYEFCLRFQCKTFHAHAIRIIIKTPAILI